MNPLQAQKNIKIRREILRIVLLVLSTMVLLSLFSYHSEDPGIRNWSTRSGVVHNFVGRFGAYLSDILLLLLGPISYLIPLFGLGAVVTLPEPEEKASRLLKSCFFILSVALFAQAILPAMTISGGKGGGILGYSFVTLLEYPFGSVGLKLISISLIFISVIILTHKTLASLAKPALSLLKKRGTPKPAKIKEEDVIVSEQSVTSELPSQVLLEPGKKSTGHHSEDRWIADKTQFLLQKLQHFGVEGEIVNVCQGPVITVFEFKPASGVKIKEIAGLSDDLTLALSVTSVRIVAPIPGKPVVGIEVPSPHRQTVYFRDLIEETAFFDKSFKIPLILGRTVPGNPLLADLATMPHLLIAGSTGTGKSVFINTLICSLLFRFSYKELKLILVDPKMVELNGYEDIPHLMLPVVVDPKKAVLALRWAVEEMERRYQLLHHETVRNIESYNVKMKELGKEPLPYTVIIIDEYADLMSVVQKDVELSIARLAQKARASGIHLVLATQRPSTDVVTGTIKANFPSRISFRVASSVDSKTILDRTGAERLLGQGDLLFQSPGFISLQRLQGPFLSDSEIEKTTTFLKKQAKPNYQNEILEQAENISVPASSPRDELFETARKIVIERGEASISLLQRYLHIGYNRAASLMEDLEKEGIVGAAAAPTKRRAIQY